MKVRFETMDRFRVAGYVLHTTNEGMEGYKKVPAFWAECIQNGRCQTLMPLISRPPFGIIGLNVYNTDPDNAQKFDYYIACATDAPLSQGMEELVVPAATWAIFPCTRETVAQTERSIVTEWQPASGYTLLNSGYETGNMKGGAPDMEVYGKDDTVEIWVAVKKIP